VKKSLSWQDFFSLQRFGITADLRNIRLFCSRLGHPEEDFPSVHIGGTNGKGSVVATLDSILRAGGLKVGMYTSPHLSRFEERIHIEGKPISEEAVFQFLEEHWEFIQKERCTFFETATAMALEAFRNAGVDIAVIEVGLGGTYDATRVVKSILSVITRIDFDHTERLGNTLEAIAGDKAGIFAQGKPALTGDQLPEVLDVLRNRARLIESPFFHSDEIVTLSSVQFSPQGITGDARLRCDDVEIHLSEFHFPLCGYFQMENLKTALAASALLSGQITAVHEKSIAAGISSVTWRGRLQVLREKPYLIADVGHNPGAVKNALHSLRTIWNPRKIIAVFSALRDKDVRAMLQHLQKEADKILLVPLSCERGLNAAELSEIANAAGLSCGQEETVTAALNTALNLASPEDLILVIGSHYLVGELLKIGKFS
jgi:dihydrofolate synthase/folylpolyglutamate synthase